ncbi:hypothetical protein EMIT0111MI5_30252 [Burkholderia sp. IT-111MI5]
MSGRRGAWLTRGQSLWPKNALRETYSVPRTPATTNGAIELLLYGIRRSDLLKTMRQ